MKTRDKTPLTVGKTPSMTVVETPSIHSLARTLLLIPLLLTLLSGCGSTSTVVTDTASSEKTTVSEESYSRVFAEDELVGYVGFRKINVKVGKTTSDLGVFQVYNSAFELLGTYDQSGNTRVFRRNDQVLLGTFAPEDSVRQITGLSGKIRIVDGLQ